MEQMVIKVTLGKKGKDSPRSIKVYQFDIEGNLIKIFDSITEASQNSGAQITKISKAILKKIILCRWVPLVKSKNFLMKELYLLEKIVYLKNVTSLINKTDL